MKPSSISRSHSVVESVRSHYAALSRAASQDHDIQKESVEPKREPLTKEELKLISAMLVSVAAIWTLYGNIATFYPPFRKTHHSSITDTQVGIVLAMFEGGQMIASPLIGITLSKVGKRNYIYLGNLVCIIASVGFGLLTHISDDTTFFILSLIMRIMQGVGDAAVTCACLSLISSEFPTRREQMIGYFEGATGTGQMLGPVIGQALYSLLDFEYTFYCTGAILCIPIILNTIYVPSDSKANTKEHAQSMTSSQRISNERKITFRMLFTNMRVVMACLSSIIAMIIMMFYQSILSDRLIEEGISEDVVGYAMAITCLAYVLTTPLVGWLSAKVRKIYLSQISFALAAFSLLLFGPSKLLGFPDSVPILMIGMAALGFSCVWVFVPLMPELIEAVQDKEQIQENEDLNDKASSLFNFSYAIGCLIAPILGGALNELYGFRTTCDIMAMSALVFGGLYFFINVLPFLISLRKNKVKRNRLHSSNSRYQGGPALLKEDFHTMSIVLQEQESSNQPLVGFPYVKGKLLPPDDKARPRIRSHQDFIIPPRFDSFDKNSNEITSDDITFDQKN